MRAPGQRWAFPPAPADPPPPRSTAAVRRLTFERFELAGPRRRFHYRFEGRAYHRDLVVGDTPEEAFARADPEILHRLLGHVGVAFAPQLFALADFTHFTIEPLALPEAGLVLFRETFRRGLAELRYRNGLDPEQEVTIEADGAPAGRPALVTRGEGALLFNGGGKDSAVAAEALRAAGLPFTWLAVDPTAAMDRLAEASGSPARVALRTGGGRARIRRHRRLRGHRPFNSLLAFLGVLAAFLHGRRHVVAANERSASHPTLRLPGLEINHQYTKSLDFERRFAAYLAGELLAGIDYWSVLRPLWEIQIGRLFAGLPRYHAAFRSCNRGLYADGWCLACPKCAFTALLLQAFLPAPEVTRILGADPTASAPLRRWIATLVEQERRPWDCVGTQGECRLALALANRDGQPPLVVDEHLLLPSPEEVADLTRVYLSPLDGPHRIPQGLAGPILELFRH